MAQQNPNGPFGEYLTKPLEPTPVPKLTGWEDATGNIANIATQFLNGVKQSRAQKFAMQQMQEQKEEEKINRTLDFVQKADLSPADKQHLSAPLMQALIGRIASDKDFSSKSTGHPLTDFVKNIAVNLTGGQLPNKKQPLDPNLINDVMLHAADPTNSLTAKKSLLEQRAHAAISDILTSKGNKATYDDLLQNPAMADISHEWTNNGLEGYPSAIVEFAKTHPRQQPLNELQQAEADAANMKNTIVRDAFGLPAPQPSAPVPATSPIPGSNAGPTVAPSVGVEQSTVTAKPPISHVDLKKARAQNFAIPGYNKIGDIKQFNTPDKKIVNGIEVVTPDFTGVIDEKGDAIPGAKEVTTAQLNAPTPEKIKNVINAGRTTIKTAVTPAVAKQYEGLLDIAEQSGDIASVDNLVKSAIDAQRSIDDRLARLQETHLRSAAALDDKEAKQGDALFKIALNSPEFKTFLTTDQNLKGATMAVQDSRNKGDNSLADIQLIRALAIATDPNSTVREEEFKTFQSAMGWLRSRYQGLANLYNGKGELLSDGMRDQVLKAIQNRRQALQQAKNQRITSIIQRAGSHSTGLADSLRNTFTDSGDFEEGATTTATPPVPQKAAAAAPVRSTTPPVVIRQTPPAQSKQLPSKPATALRME